MARDTPVRVGVIAGAHGIKGEVKLLSFTAEPAAIASYSPLSTAAGGRIVIVKLRPQKDHFIASLDGVADRNAAEALKGAELFVARTRLPDPAAGEFYVNDLVGLPVVRPDGTILGEVAGVANYGAGDLLDVKIAGRRDTALIPLAPPFVTAVEEARVVVDLPEDYLDEGVRPGDA